MNFSSNARFSDINQNVDVKIKNGELYSNTQPGKPEILTDKEIEKNENDLIKVATDGKLQSNPSFGLLTRGFRDPNNYLTKTLSRTTATDGQKDSVKLIINSDDRTVAVQGYAGTG